MSDRFHAIFVLFFFAMIALRLFYHHRAGTFGRRAEMREGIAREGVFARLRWLLALPWGVTLITYMAWPAGMRWAALPLPDSVRWAGAVANLLALVLLAWVHSALGKQFSGTLALRTDHELITHGPYRWVRHPMYTAFLLMHTGCFLLSGNLLLGFFGFATVWALVQLRTPLEEAQLEGRFGGAYAAYRLRTGRLLPAIRR